MALKEVVEGGGRKTIEEGVRLVTHVKDMIKKDFWSILDFGYRGGVI